MTDGCPSRKTAAAYAAAVHPVQLLRAEGHAVGALVNSGIHLVGAHQDFVQGAVIFVAAMMGTLCDGTLNTLVGMAIHR